MVYTESDVRLSGFDWVSLALVTVGALNRGLFGPYEQHFVYGRGRAEATDSAGGAD